jgi:copper chaperone
MKKAVIQLETLACPSCMQKIENAVKGLTGVDESSVKVLFNASKVRLDFNSALIELADIEKAIGKLGYQVLKSKLKPA